MLSNIKDWRKEMKTFKDIFDLFGVANNSKKSKKQELKNETWYNNSQEILEKGLGEMPTDTSALVPSSMYMQSSKQLNH